MLTDPLAVLAVAALTAAATTASSPRWALAVLLVALPFAAHHPSTAQSVLLVVLTAVFEVIYLLRTRPSVAATLARIGDQPLLLLGALFVVAAFLSLSSLPLASIWQQWAAASGPAPSAQHLASLALDWLLLNEERREFSITAAFLTLEGFVLALIVWRETRASSAMAVRMAAAITLGMVVAVVLGLLEAYAGVGLQALRREAAGSVAVRPGTLQSVAGNPGWFSQYLVYALPYAIVFLAGTSAFPLRVAALATATGVTAFALLTAFQRGGWVTGAVVLAYVAGIAINLRPSGTGAGGTMRRALVRTAALAAMLVVVISAGFALWTRQVAPGSTFDATAYLARLKSITSGDRMPYLIAGLEIGAIHPVLGGGHESFAYRYASYFRRAGGPFHRSDVRLPVPSSAHSVYLQAFSGTGAIGACLIVGIFATAALTAYRARMVADIDRGRRTAMAAACGSLLGMAVYGLVQEVFYVHALRLLFFVGVGLTAGVGADLVRWPSGVKRGLWLALAAAFAAHLTYEYVWPGPDRLLRSGEPTGLYDEDPNVKGMRWSTDRATWPVPAGATRFLLRVRSFAPYAQDVEIRGCRGVAATLHVADHEWHALEGMLDGCGAGEHLRLEVTPTWSPRGESRTLGIIVSDVRLE